MDPTSCLCVMRLPCLMHHDTNPSKTRRKVKTPPPSVAYRNALRAALRRHPDIDKFLHGRDVSALSKADLELIASGLGIDLDTLSTAAVAPVTAPMHAPDQDPDADSHGTPDSMTDNADAPDLNDAIEKEVAKIRGLIISGGFAALDQRLRELVTEANKPPVMIEVPVAAPDANGNPAIVRVHVARKTGQDATWSKLFGVRGDLGKRTTALWDGTHPDTPKVNPKYIFPQPATALALATFSDGANVMLYGPAGTGKTEFAQQVAARTGRPFALISCDAATDGPTLVGMTVPSADGAVAWQDGQLTRAIQTPGCIVCLDEPSVARPGALFVLQNVYANRVLYITETGRRVKVADGVLFIATDNTNGTGGGGRKGYTDTNKLNTAFLDRFALRIKFDYLPEAREAELLVAYTGCTRALADLLVSAATTTRAAADNQTLSHGIGLRRLIPWARRLMDGFDPEDAFKAAVLNCAPEQDVETLRQQCLLAYSKANVAQALNPPAVDPDVTDPSATNPTPAGRNAAVDFAN